MAGAHPSLRRCRPPTGRAACSASSIPTSPRARNTSLRSAPTRRSPPTPPSPSSSRCSPRSHPSGVAEPAPLRRSLPPTDDRSGPVVVTGPPGAGTHRVALGLAAAVATRPVSGPRRRRRAGIVDGSPAGARHRAQPPERRRRVRARPRRHDRRPGPSTGHPPFDVLCGLPSLAAATQVSHADVLDVVVALGACRKPTSLAGGVGRGRNRDRSRRDRRRRGARRRRRRQSGRRGPAPRMGGRRSRRSVVPLHLVVNRAPTDRYQREEITRRDLPHVPPASLTFVPTDRRVERGMGGRTGSPRPVHRRCGRVAHAAVPPTARPLREGRRRAAEAGHARSVWRTSRPGARHVAPKVDWRERGHAVGAPVTVDAYDVIRRDVLARIERRRLRPDVDLDEVRGEAVRAGRRVPARCAMLGEQLPLADPAVMVDRVLRSITDLGPLTDLLARRDVEEIFIEGARVSYLDGSGRLRGLTVPTSEDENRQVVERLLAPTDRQLNTKHPMVQARVLDGTARLTAAIPPIGDRSRRRCGATWCATSRSPIWWRATRCRREAAAFLTSLMQLRSRVAVSGEPGAGKTTLARRAARGGARRAIASVRARRSASWRCRSPTAPTTRSARPRSTAPARSRCAIWSSSCSRCDPIGSSSARCGAPRRSSSAARSTPAAGSCAPSTPNSASEALDALVNAALMAGENVTERIVRKVFSRVARRRGPPRPRRRGRAATPTRVRRQVMEIAAVVPALRDDFTIEPLFVRDEVGVRRSRWTGALPPSLERASGQACSLARSSTRARVGRGEPASVSLARRALHRGVLLLRCWVTSLGRPLALRRCGAGSGPR